MTKHRAVVTGYDPTFENPDGSTGRPKGVQTAADMRVATSYDVLEEGIFALHGTPAVVTSPVNTIQITPFMAAIESPNGGYYVIKTTENETVELNLTNTGNVKVYVQQQDWELDNDVAAADSAVVFGVAYGATAIPEGALLLFTSTLSGQTSTSGMTFTPAFKYTGAASGVIRVPAQSDLDDVAVLETGIRALTLSGDGEFFYGEDDAWHVTSVGNPQLESGWFGVPDTWTFSSFNSSTRIGIITVPSNATSKYSAGMKVRISQATGGIKYGFIVAVSATTLTVFFGLSYTLNNQAISSPNYSSFDSPLGYDGPILTKEPYANRNTNSMRWTLTQHGWHIINGTGTADMSAILTFPVAFASAPIVNATYGGNGDSGLSVTAIPQLTSDTSTIPVETHVSAITTSQAAISTRRASGTFTNTVDYGYHWTAKGPVI